MGAGRTDPDVEEETIPEWKISGLFPRFPDGTRCPAEVRPSARTRSCRFGLRRSVTYGKLAGRTAGGGTRAGAGEAR
ncbi:hypothetical protein GCM10009736_63230 [Actinomadura bangladeshensis]